MGHGKTISGRPDSRPSAISRAASSASMMKGMGKELLSVISVRTKPGQTVVTRTPFADKDARIDSRRVIWADFVAA